MKRTFLLIIILSLLITSCYISAITEYELTIVDNGQYDGDRTYRIVTIAGPDGFDYFYYNASFDSVSKPTSDSKKYSPHEYKGVDSNTYTGMPIKEGQTVKAIGYKNANGNVCSSFIAEITLPVSKWDITIVDNGPYSEDETLHIVTITDSSWSGSIYYDFGKNADPTNFSTDYEARKYEGINGKEYSGVLVSAGSVINAVSYKKIGNGTFSSNIARKDLNQWSISIVDNGPSLDDNSKRIVSIVDSVYSSTDIYYTLDGTTPSSSSTKYAPQEYQGTDSKTYTGVLLPEATTVKTVADRTENGNVITSFVSEVTTDINQWEISIIDHGEAEDDNTKRIVSIIDNKWNGDIYFRTDGGEFYTWERGGVGLVSYESLRYSPSEYIGIDGNTYTGVLVGEDAEVKAISCVAENGKLQKSNIAKAQTGINQWEVSIIDNGPWCEDKNKRIITVSDLKWSGEIYYVTGNSKTEAEWEKYNGTTLCGVDSESYEGVLVSEGTLIKVQSRIVNKGELITSVTKSYVTDFYHWGIDIIDNGPSKDDITKHIVSIEDSVEHGKIYYSLDKMDPDIESAIYTPTYIVGSDSESHLGILVSENDTVKAVSYIENDGKIWNSFISEELVMLKIGGKGLAGGYIFYDKGYYSDGWRYLEASPSLLTATGRLGYERDSFRFGYYNTGGTILEVGTSEDIGTGYSNTKLLSEKQNSVGNPYGYDLSDVAKECEGFSLNGYSDWFIPSKKEMELVCINLYEKGKLAVDGEYWTSTELNSSRAWICRVYNGRSDTTDELRYYENYVRPVRAF